VNSRGAASTTGRMRASVEKERIMNECGIDAASKEVGNKT
jgi:hypothetical protein